MFRRTVLTLLCLLLCSVPVFAEDPPVLPEGSPALSGFDPQQQALSQDLLALTPALGEQPVYLAEPSVTAPYAIGALNPAYLETGLQYVNYIRTLAASHALHLIKKAVENATEPKNLQDL